MTSNVLSSPFIEPPITTVTQTLACFQRKVTEFDTAIGAGAFVSDDDKRTLHSLIEHLTILETELNANPN